MAVSRSHRTVRLGIHTFVWSATTTEAILEILPRVAACGYAGVELPLLAPSGLDIPRIRTALREHGLDCTASSALPKGYSLIDASTQAATVDWLARVVEDAAALGSPVLCGPLLTPIGEMRGRGPTQEEWETGVGALRELGDRIAGSGVTIALEPLNRFESFVVNTVEDAVRIVQEVDRPAIRLLLDTFHMNIEEADIPAAIAHACEYTAHFHLSESHRGSVGAGHISWDAVLHELAAGGYDGWLVVESFGTALPDLASAASIWRPMAASPDALATESMAFLDGRLN